MTTYTHTAEQHAQLLTVRLQLLDSPNPNDHKAASLLDWAVTAEPVAPEYDVRKILVAVVPGEDGMGREVYAKSVDEVVGLLTDMGQQIEVLKAAEPAHSDKNAEFADWMLHGIEISGEAATGFKLNPAVRDVLVERQRQISIEGWTPEHDDEHDTGELALAASCYACAGANLDDAARDWPWDASWFKPDNQHRNLVKAGALILAAIARLYRAADKKES